MTQPHPPIILFDFDGVIITQTSLELAALKQLKNPFYNWKNIENMRLIDYARLIEQSDSKNKLEAFNHINGAYKKLIPSPIKRLLFFVQFRRDYPKLEKIYDKLRPNMEEVLELLKKNNLPMGIVSNTGGSRLEYFNKKFNLEKYFSVLFSRDDTTIRKPEPYPLILALTKIKQKFGYKKIKKNLVYYIGDLPTDILCANRAGVNSVALLSGHGLKTDLELQDPDFSIKDIKEILEIKDIKRIITS